MRIDALPVDLPCSGPAQMSNLRFAAAFGILFRDSLKLTREDELVVVYDETLSPFWNDLLAAIKDHASSTTFVHLPAICQAELSRGSPVQLPLGLQVAVSEADVVVTILSGDITLAGVRRALVSKAIGQQRAGSRLAHIPGISSDILDVLTRSPIETIETHCEMVAWALGEARTATLTTRDRSGNDHQLTCDLAGWFNEPLMSPGVIYHGSWGNVPPGETFCCPNPRGVIGSVAINGSIPGHVCADSEEVILEFEQGRLRRWVTDAEPLRQFFVEQAALATERGDANWNAFAELGIGLNPAVTQLTGNSLFDEKAYGTIHIAIGDNSGFGHPIESQIHADLVSREPSLLLDDHLVIARGNILTSAISNWRGSLNPAAVDPTRLHRLQVRSETLELKPHWQDAISRRLHSRGRTGYVRIADGTDAATLRLLFEALSPDDWQIPARVVMAANRIGIPTESLARILGLLVHYHMLQAVPDPLTLHHHADT
jgi:hypothetical protein